MVFGVGPWIGGAGCRSGGRAARRSAGRGQWPNIIYILADDLGCTVPQAGKGIELYNLAEDAAERNNLAAQHPETVQTIARLMSDARTDSAEFPIRPSARDGAPGRGRSE